jgi:hypothetical protein
MQQVSRGCREGMALDFGVNRVVRPFSLGVVIFAILGGSRAFAQTMHVKDDTNINLMTPSRATERPYSRYPRRRNHLRLKGGAQMSIVNPVISVMYNPVLHPIPGLATRARSTARPMAVKSDCTRGSSMHPRNASVLAAVVLAALCPYSPGPAEAEAQPVAGVRVRVDALKRSTFERKASDGPVFVGPQSAFELEWRVLNRSGGTLDIPSPGAVLRLRVASQGREIPVRTEWAAGMDLRSTINGEFVRTTVPLGSAALTDRSSLWVRGSTRPADGSVFAPGEYVLELEATGLQQVSAESRRTVPALDRGFPILARILEVNSLERQRQFHMIEGAFYKGIDKSRALEHYTALASLPGTTWGDSLTLGWIYGELGRHKEASAAFRRILPDLIRALDSPYGQTFRNAGHLRRAAMSFAVEGDVAGAASLLRLEGRTPEARIPGEIEQLRNFAPKPGVNPK